MNFSGIVLSALRFARPLLLSMLLCAGTNAAATAQQIKTVTTRGTVEQIVPSGLVLKTRADALWAVAIDPRVTDITVEGTATVESLKPGTIVRVSGLMTTADKLDEPAKEIVICSLRPSLKVGVHSQAIEDPNTRGKRAMEHEPGDYMVVGAIRTVEDGKLTIAAGRATVTVELAAKAKVGIDVIDYTLAQPGDTISATGQSQQARQMLAATVRIKLKKPVEAK